MILKSLKPSKGIEITFNGWTSLEVRSFFYSFANYFYLEYNFAIIKIVFFSIEKISKRNG
jgi:hypothetical protein